MVREEAMAEPTGRPGRGAKLYLGCLLLIVLVFVGVLFFVAPAWWPWSH